MTKKRRNLRILASIIAAGCVWSAGMGNAWAAVGTTSDGIRFEYDPENFDNASHGNSYEAMVVLTAKKNDDGSTDLGITLYRGDKNDSNGIHLTHGIDYMDPTDAIYALGDELYHPGYDYTQITSLAPKLFNDGLTQIIESNVVALLQSGDGIWVTGTGEQNNPYIVNAVDSQIQSYTQNTITPYTATGNGGEIVSTIVERRPVFENGELKIDPNTGAAVYEDKKFEQTVDISGYVQDVVKNEAGNAIINYAGDNQNTTTIEQAINNNYNNIVNNTNKIENIENNYVTNISQNTEQFTDINGNTYNIDYYSVTQNVTNPDTGETKQETLSFKDTTLVQKNAFNGISAAQVIADARYGHLGQDSQEYQDALDGYKKYMSSNALAGYVDPKTGMPILVTEFQDTSGNVVQGAFDIGTLFLDAVEVTTDNNIKVISNTSDGINIEIALNDNVHINNELTVGTKNITINDSGIDMKNTKIINVQDGEISANSTEAINGSQLWETNQNIDKLGGRLDKVGAGAAALAALHPLDFDPDDKLQFSAGVGNYKGETAAALGAFYRPTEKVMFSVAGTMGNGENMVNAGITFALDRKNNVSNSRVAMAHEIQDLRDQVAALTALVSQIAGKGNPLLDTVMFPDVPENHWAYDYVESLQKRGIIEGYPDGNFAGDRSMTRYEYAAMLYRALEKGFPVDGRLLKEFEAELGRIRIDRIKGTDADANKVERVRVNDYQDRDDYGSKLAQVVADAAPVIEEPAA